MQQQVCFNFLYIPARKNYILSTVVKNIFKHCYKQLFFSGGQSSGGNSFSSGPSFNPRPTYPSGNNFNWQRPSDQVLEWNQGNYNWEPPVYPNYQQPLNNGPSFGNINNGDNGPSFGNGIIA